MLISILNWLYGITANYGWAIVIFTFLIRLVLFPFDYKSRVSMRKTATLQPKMQELQKKYANDKNKLNQKMGELYKKEGVSPLSGCLPMLLSYPILIWMFSSMRTVANQQMVSEVFAMLQNPDEVHFSGWLWIKNLWMPDSPFSTAVFDVNTLRQIPSNVWTDLIAQHAEWAPILEQLSLTTDSFSNANLQATIQTIIAELGKSEAFVEASAKLPGWNFNLLITSLQIMKYPNGFFILPVLSAVSQFLMTSMTPTQPTAAQDQSQASTGKFMKYFFPLFSLWICSSYNAVFAIYWVTSNLIAMAQTYFLNKYLDKKDQQKKNISAEYRVN